MAGSHSKLITIARDIKLSHTLFAMPFALLATFMASGTGAGAGGWPRPGILLLIILCMVFARTVAMSMNRILDARLDRLNPRTAARALPSGKVSLPFYIAVAIACMAAFILSTAAFWRFYNNPWPLLLSVPVLAYLCGYPLMKRFTRLCHYYLGLALGLAPVCAWVAVAGSVSWPPAIMCLAVLCWTAGFDIIYACQDYESDRQTGIFSIPAKIGIAPALWVARLTHLFCWLLLLTLWFISPPLGRAFLAAVILAGLLLMCEHSLVKPHDLSKLSMAFFTMNGIISSLLGLAGIIDALWR